MYRPSTMDMDAEHASTLRDPMAASENTPAACAQPMTDSNGAPASEEHEPDYRFTLANERTFLAWIRTALALLAGSVAIVQLVPHFAMPDVRKMLGALLAMISVTIAIYSSGRWYLIQQAMRRDAPLPRSLIVWLLTGTIAFVGALVLLFDVVYGIGA
jgi:putative membrane protein